ncbi:TetR/AcrR family transcriptional regulator [Dickeya sp. NCPPB 3274]|uniref:TetR/AcrR family transcriptional regulator n=1 Tax=Dickeya sp. NCPPB 3274 TaxID=568766 RepID=UPI0003A129D0|nr:TetR/AcrR family transcriptional regulator [Dickeya sp. NCPPB 3274]
MQARTLSVDRICVAAAAHFAEHGYDAASLNEIAKAVNIKKASLYSHFASKNALFMTVFDDTLRIETAFAQQCFDDETPDELPGSHYFSCLAKRYADSAYLRFLLRTGYLAPAALYDQISLGYEQYLGLLLNAFINKLHSGHDTRLLPADDVEQLGQAYLGIVDSLHVKLVYTAEPDFSRRLTAMRRLLSDALQCAILSSRQSRGQHHV